MDLQISDFFNSMGRDIKFAFVQDKDKTNDWIYLCIQWRFTTKHSAYIG